MFYGFTFSPTKLRKARENAGRSREHLAVLSGTSFETIKSYENGARTPSRQALIRLAGALGCSPADFCEPDEAFQPEAVR